MRAHQKGNVNMAKCKVCEYCGAYLDFGERCDCQEQCRNEHERYPSEEV